MDRLIQQEMNLPEFASTITKMVRGKLFRKYPVDPELLIRAAQLQSIAKLHEMGLNAFATDDLSNMELHADARQWGRIKTFAPFSRAAQVYLSRYLQSGKMSDLRKVFTACKRNQ